MFTQQQLLLRCQVKAAEKCVYLSQDRFQVYNEKWNQPGPYGDGMSSSLGKKIFYIIYIHQLGCYVLSFVYTEQLSHLPVEWRDLHHSVISMFSRGARS